jgi:hypothetical protein
VGTRYFKVGRCRKGDRAFNSTYPPESFRVPVTLALKLVG